MTTTTPAPSSRRSSKAKTKKGEIKNVVLYARVSTVEQAEKDLSIPAQLDALRRYCAQRGLHIVEEFREEGASGTDEHRPQFKRMFERVMSPANDVDGVLVYQTSRFMRNAGKARVFKDVLRKSGVHVVAICQETSDDPMGQFVEGIFELIDQYESDVNGMRTSAAMRENARRGFFNGSRAPYGFRIERVEGRPGIMKGKLARDAAEAAIVPEIFRLYTESGGAKGTARALNARGLLYRQEKPWTKDLVLRVLDEQAAVGTYFWGRTDGSRGRTKEEDWIAIPVEPIITRDIFDAARKLRDEREPSPGKGRTPSSPLLLAGLVKCGRCGASYQLETGKGYRYYNCRSFCRSGKETCAGFRIPTAELETAVLTHLADHLFTPERCVALFDAVVEEASTMNARTTDVRKQLKKESDEIEKKIARWTEAFESGALAATDGAVRVHELRARQQDLTEAIQKVIPLRKPPAHARTPAALRRFQASIRGLFLGSDHALAKSYLRFLVESITVRETEIEIQGRPQAAMKLMVSGDAQSEAGRLLTAPPQVLASDLDWLRHLGSNQGPCD